MAKPINFDDSADTEDLQALFDSIAVGKPATPPPAPVANASGDSDDLQALFDSVVDQVSVAPASPPPPVDTGPESMQEATYKRIGQMARQLHDSLRGLGYDKILEDTAKKIPDARQRLAYIAQMTEQAASRVLNATDIAKPLQDDLLKKSAALSTRWDQMFANRLSVDEFKALAADSRLFFHDAPEKIAGTNEQLTEIMMAQDFQDLTGQVIKKIIDMVQSLEAQLLQVLIEVMPEERKAAAPDGLMNGPVINAEGRADVVTTQTQVDDLLESLGF